MFLLDDSIDTKSFVLGLRIFCHRPPEFEAYRMAVSGLRHETGSKLWHSCPEIKQSGGGWHRAGCPFLPLVVRANILLNRSFNMNLGGGS
jgi:hypothetical protein